jgi:cystathionine beta-lyase/cystathionine gamma-synthase
MVAPRHGVKSGRSNVVAMPSARGRHQFEHHLTIVEQSRYAVSFISGRTALDAIFRSLPTGARVTVDAGAHPWVSSTLTMLHGPPQRPWSVQSFDDDLPALWMPDTRVVICSSPTEPVGHLVDLSPVVEPASRDGAVIAVDASANLFGDLRPLQAGADLTVHLHGGALLGQRIEIGVVATNHATWAEAMLRVRTGTGTAPTDEWCNDVMPQLLEADIRWERLTHNADTVARYLMQHDHVLAVHHAWGAASLVCFSVSGRDHADAVVNELAPFRRRVDYGSQWSVVTMTTGAVGTEEHLVQCDVGTDDVDELLDALADALAA